MSTIVKETEAIAGLPEGAAARPATPSADAGAKPQPVALEVSVTVNGARTVEGSEKREPFAESTKTVLVFGNGAVIRLQASVAPGQLLFLTNEKTKKEVVCQVVKSKNYRNISGYVELEFTETVVGFWGMRFPGDRLAPQPGTPNVVQAAPATGSPMAPQIAAIPAPVASAATVEAKVSAPVIAACAEKLATIPAPTKPAPSAAASTPAAPTTPASNATTIPAAPAVPLVVKTEFTVSSSAPKSVLPLTGTLSLPRAAEAKPTVPAPVATAPKVPAPVVAPPIAPAAPAAPVATTPTSSTTATSQAAKPGTDFSAESLRAENARLQEQLAALLNPQKNNAASVAPAPVTSAPPSSTPAAASATPTADATAKILEFAQAEPAKTEKVSATSTPVATSVGTPSAKPDAWLPDLAAVLAQDNAATRDAKSPQTAAPASAIHPVTPPGPVIPIAPVAPKPVAPANISTASLQSLLDEEQVKIPSWLEPLARNAAPTGVVDDGVSGGSLSGAATPAHGENDTHDELDDVFEHRSDDLSETLAKAHEDGTAEESRGEEGAENVPIPTFGSRLSLEESGSTEGAGKGKVLAIAALILAAVAGGGYWYTQQNGAVFTGGAQSAVTPKMQTETQIPAPASAAVAEANQPQTRTLSNAAGVTLPSGAVKNPAATQATNQAPTPAPVNANLVVEKTRAAQAGNGLPAASAENPVQQPAPKHALGDVHLAAPNVTRRGDGGAVSDAEVSLGNGDAENAPAVNGFVSTSGPAAPLAPVQIGGSVTPAKLLKSAPPVYPAFAKTQRVSGDVKIDALIDAAGQVTTMKVVSGPPVLHQAAMDALHQWKYQPASLDGKPVPMHLTVTIQFRLQ
jgi:protein TonB